MSSAFSHSPQVTGVHAVVDAGAVSTPYVRAGVGSTVLLLCSAARPSPLVAPLFAALTSSFRVIAPHDPRVCRPETNLSVAFPVWLRGFLDGLGVERTAIVAQEEMAARALGFALSDPLRVSRLALTYRDAADAAHENAAERDLLGTSHPLLVQRFVGDEVHDVAVTTRLLEFLRGAP